MEASCELVPIPWSGPADLIIEEFCATDLNKGFLESIASLGDPGLTYSEAIQVFQSRLRAGQRTFVVKIKDSVVGTATLLLERKFIHKGGLVGHIEDVAVRKEYQRQGIGTVLVEHVTQEAQKLGCYKVILNCLEDVTPFYTRLGFRNHDLGMRLDWKS